MLIINGITRPRASLLFGLKWPTLQSQVRHSGKESRKCDRKLTNMSRHYLKYTKEPFAITAFGMKFYVVTQAKHSAEVYRNTETLSFENFVQGLMKINGNDEDVIEAVYAALPTNKPGFPNPQGESLGVLAQRMHAHQLHPGENLLTLENSVQNWIHHHLNQEDISACVCANPDTSSSIQVPLYRWCSEYFIQLGQDVYFGKALTKIDPDLPMNFFKFDELIWKMLYQYPTYMSSDMITSRTQVIGSLQKYFETPQAQRSNDTAWLTNVMEIEMRALGLNDFNLAVVMFHLYLA